MEIKNITGISQQFGSKQRTAFKGEKELATEKVRINLEEMYPEPPKKGLLKEVMTERPSAWVAFWATLGGSIGFVVGDILKLRKLNKIKPGKSTFKPFGKEFMKKAAKIQGIGVALGLGLGGVFYFLSKKEEPKNKEKAKGIVSAFNEKHNTSIKLETADFSNKYLLGKFSPEEGKITMNNGNFKDILFSNLCIKETLKQELKSANQFIEIARPDGGIERINYLFLKTIAKRLDGDKAKEIAAAYEEIKNGLADEYKDEYVKISREGYSVKLSDYLEAMNGYLSGKKPNEIPIIINKEFYEEANKDKPPLTVKERAMAEYYLEKWENYKEPETFKDVINEAFEQVERAEKIL